MQGKLVYLRTTSKQIFGEPELKIKNIGTDETMSLPKNLVLEAMKNGASINGLQLVNGDIEVIRYDTDDIIGLYDLIVGVQKLYKIDVLYINNLNSKAYSRLSSEYSLYSYSKHNVFGKEVLVQYNDGQCTVWCNGLGLESQCGVNSLKPLEKLSIRNMVVRDTTVENLLAGISAKHIEFINADFSIVKVLKDLCSNCDRLVTFSMNNCKVRGAIQFDSAFRGCLQLKSVSIPRG